MRSNLITVATAVASTLLVASMASANDVQEQLRLMEQRMAEMEDRLQATSEDLKTARATVDEQQALLSDAGLVELEDEGLRSSVGNFFEEIDVNGLVAGSYNHRLRGEGDNNLNQSSLFTHPNANTFQVDQAILSLTKQATTENRAGMHLSLWSGTSADQQIDGINDSEVGLYAASASYLAPIGDGVEFSVGKLVSPLGAEALQTNRNYNISSGILLQMTPIVNTGIQAAVPLGDELTFLVGVVNDVYSDTTVDDSRDKAYYAQLAYEGDAFGLKVGAIVGKNSNSDFQASADTGGGVCQGGDECKTSVFNTILTAQPSENTSLWADFVWVRNFGAQTAADGDAYGVAVAGRQQLTDRLGAAARIEYARMDAAYNRSIDQGFAGGVFQQSEMMTFTATLDKALTDCVTARVEGRYDLNLSNAPLFAFDNRSSPSPGSSAALSDRDDQLTLLAQIFYEF